MKGKKGWHDGAMIALLLILSAAGYFVFAPRKDSSGSSVKIQVDGATVATLSLQENTAYEYRDGNEKNVIVIENGSVYMAEANCTNQQCVLQGKIRHAGETIVCLPHRLVVSVTEKNDGGLDGMVQ